MFQHYKPKLGVKLIALQILRTVHVELLVAPMLNENVPAGQLVQTLVLALVANVPLGHCRHEMEPVVEV